MGSIRIEQQVTTVAPLEALIAVALQPGDYVAYEPRLVSARWLDAGAPYVGARMEVVTDMPFTISIVRRIVGNPRGTVTITEWDPPRRFAGHFNGRGLNGEFSVDLHDRGGIRQLDVDGAVTPASKWAWLMLQPLRPRLEQLAAQSVQRGLKRLEGYLAESKQSL